MAEAQRRTRTPHLHLKSDDPICDTGAGSARGTGEATHHKPAAASEEAVTPQNCSKIAIHCQCALNSFAITLSGCGGSNCLPQKGSREGAGPPEAHHAPCQRLMFVSIAMFQMIHHRFPRAQPPPQSAGSNFLSAHDTIHGF